jgi:DNA repair protein RecN (Recombination protein N)
MLCELHLRNLAVAADVSLALDAGLNVLTGSTGAGKSLVAEAVRWLRGEAIDRSVIRGGEESASAEAVFDLHARPELVEQLHERGVAVAEDGVLTLRREVRTAGRSRAWIDGRLASAKLLSEIGNVLIQSQAQHVQLGLLDARHHVEVLDALGVEPDLVHAWHEARSDYQAVRRAIAEWSERRERLQEQREILEFQHRELEDAGLAGDELDDLRRTVSLMEGGARLIELAQNARDRLDDESRGGGPAIGEAIAQLRRGPEEVEEVVLALEALEGAAELVREASANLENVLDSADVDPQAFETAQERLSLIQQLSRKYGRTEGELVRLRDRLTEQLSGLDSADGIPANLHADEERARARVDAAGRALHSARKKVARRATADAESLLIELGMDGAELSFQFTPEVDPAGPVRIEGRRVQALANGPAAVTLMARTNRGERPSPVHQGASGGELARIALVLRSLSLRGQAPALLLLDEVDAGIGADLAPAVGARLTALAEAGQLLVITHQAHIAGRADRHLLAVKTADDDRTASDVRTLNGASRIEELVRMIGADTPESRRLAKDMLRAEGTG